jgi:hypothetical protein
MNQLSDRQQPHDFVCPVRKSLPMKIASFPQEQRQRQRAFLSLLPARSSTVNRPNV